MLGRRQSETVGILGAVALLFAAGNGVAAEPMLVKDGRAEAVLVVGKEAGDFHRWVAGETTAAS